jgi:hypothetical protein
MVFEFESEISLDQSSTSLTDGSPSGDGRWRNFVAVHYLTWQFFLANRTLALKETPNSTKHPKTNDYYNEILKKPFILFRTTPPIPNKAYSLIETNL